MKEQYIVNVSLDTQASQPTEVRLILQFFYLLFFTYVFAIHKAIM